MQTRKTKQLKKELENEMALVQCAEAFNMVGDPTRLKICYLLCRHKELSVSEIAKIVGVSISAVSHTLRKLKKANIVENRRDFRHVYYQLKQSPVAVMLKERLNPVRDRQFFYVYVLRSLKNNMWYTGYTANLRKRFNEHNNNNVGWTKNRCPFEIIYYEACRDITDAKSREKYLKSGMGKRYIKNRLKRFLSLTG